MKIEVISMKMIKNVGAFCAAFIIYGTLATISCRLASYIQGGTDSATLAHLFAISAMLSYAICGYIGSIIFIIRFEGVRALQNILRFEYVTTGVAFAMFGPFSMIMALADNGD